ncbi:hypothetical protein [Streptomyces sp. NPDC088141]|uniref:hypothetical protein n=1 Tax=unclassified Streptomyces TaxID=2593676 RepID=UPI003436E42E
MDQRPALDRLHLRLDQVPSAEANSELTLAGYIVLAPNVFAHDVDEITETEK